MQHVGYEACIKYITSRMYGIYVRIPDIDIGRTDSCTQYMLSWRRQEMLSTILKSMMLFYNNCIQQQSSQNTKQIPSLNKTRNY
jgi:hypothetical protein